MNCLISRNVSRDNKLIKVKMSISSKFHKAIGTYDTFVIPKIVNIFNLFTTIVVMSEGSKYRNIVANSICKNKIQFIHTDYMRWKNMNSFTFELTKNDYQIYSKYDKVVVLTEKIKNDVIKEIPSLDGKISVVKNYMNVEKIKMLSLEDEIQKDVINFIVVSRVDKYKGFDRLYFALDKLYSKGYRFNVVVLGSGDDLINEKLKFKLSDFSNSVKFLGQIDNPYKYIKRSDVLLMLSRYEGLSNVIYESMIIGTPVLATNVSGVIEQIDINKNGWIVNNDEQSIYHGIKHILDNKSEIIEFKKNLEKYVYDNKTIVKALNDVIQ